LTKKQPEEKVADQPSFEEALERLEQIVHLLEEGEIGLNEALARYEEGVRLLRQSYDLLEQAERRIELLGGVDAEGNPIARPIDDKATFSQAEQAQGGGRGRRLPGEGASGTGYGNKPQCGDSDIDADGGLV